MPRHCLYAVVLLCGLLSASSANAFCGFYVAKADTDLFNQASKVVMTRHDGKTVITMVNDYQGALQDFAIVVPVPTVLERGQIHVTENAIVHVPLQVAANDLQITTGGQLTHAAGETVTIDVGGNLTLDNGSSITASIDLTVDSDLTLGPSGSISADGKGHGPANGPGAGTDQAQQSSEESMA